MLTLFYRTFVAISALIMLSLKRLAAMTRPVSAKKLGLLGMLCTQLYFSLACLTHLQVREP